MLTVIRAGAVYAATQFWSLGKDVPAEVKRSLMQLVGRDDPGLERAYTAYQAFAKDLVKDPLWNARCASRTLRIESTK